MQIFSRTRIAPTPSGFLHIGNAFSFALTAALAKRTGAKIILRIDDMDRARVHPEYVQDVFDTLRFLEIEWHEGPKDAMDFNGHFSQRFRLPLYEKALASLVSSGKVYACDCSRSQVAALHGGVYTGTCRRKNIPLDTPGVAWRVDTEGIGPIRMKSLNGTTSVDFPDGMRHFVIRKKDGFPAYQLTSVVDDVHMGVDLVVRGEDLLPSTLAQLHLASLLGGNSFMQATFYHHGLLTDGRGRKLSKSEGDVSIRSRRESGSSRTDIFRHIGSLCGLDARKWEDFDELLP